MPESQSVWAVVVARVGDGAKSRLAGALSVAQRRQLALAMLADVIDVCTQARGLLGGTLAVVDTLEARQVVERGGGIAVADPSMVAASHGTGDMNAAVRAGLRAARLHGAATAVIVPGDVPLIGVADFEALLEAAGAAPRAVILGASHDGVGTNALLLRPLDVIAPSFGPPSLQRHLRAGQSAGALTRSRTDLGLALDIDTPDDLAALAATSPPRHTVAALADIVERSDHASVCGSFASFTNF